MQLPFISLNCNLFLIFVWGAFYLALVTAEVVPFLELGFTFDYDIQGENPRVPTTAQCETIHLKWDRNGATGPSPIAPYFMQIYTSKFFTPFTIQAGDGKVNEFDYQVPFSPGTRYQICMYDSKGTAGGCQEMYTMIPNITNSNPTCKNVTFPPPLGVDAQFLSGGGFSLFGFPDQCTDISIKPLNGTPPFILTVSPPLHPPYNITSNTMDPIVWTVSVGGELPFFMSLVSSEGFGWSSGPMHAGLNGPTDCLAPGTIPKSKAHSIAAGAGVGGLFGGVFLAVIAFCLREFIQKRHKSDHHNLVDPFKDPNSLETQNRDSMRVHSEIGAPMSILPTATRLRDSAGSSNSGTLSVPTSSGSGSSARPLRGRAGTGCIDELPPSYSYADGRESDRAPPVPEKGA
ncbi:hypothetical protein VKT23_000014 [Stygiomarasmius scandens]|uniref:Fibronectin type-III domain-containing protein n=1 Tax=Marasmiellus scandens TaxID=2682957 RepID=A0ABR1K412_9AGAR